MPKISVQIDISDINVCLSDLPNGWPMNRGELRKFDRFSVWYSDGQMTKVESIKVRIKVNS